MPNKILLNLETRTSNRWRLLWNKATPTRGALDTSTAIARASVDRTSSIQVRTNGLYLAGGVEGNLIANSQYYARCLIKTGVEEIVFEAGSSQKVVQRTLNSLSDNKLTSLGKYFPEQVLEIKHSMLPHKYSLAEYSNVLSDRPYYQRLLPYYSMDKLGDFAWGFESFLLFPLGFATLHTIIQAFWNIGGGTIDLSSNSDAWIYVYKPIVVGALVGLGVAVVLPLPFVMWNIAITPLNMLDFGIRHAIHWAKRAA